MSEPTSPELASPAPTAAPAVELTLKEKRALREQARREFKASKRAELAAQDGAKAAPPAGGAAPATAAPQRTDDERTRDAAVFLRGVLFPLLSVVALLIGYRLDPLSETAAAEDATAWVPILRRYGWADSLVTWVGAPARLVARLRQLAHRKEPKEPGGRVVGRIGEERPA